MKHTILVIAILLLAGCTQSRPEFPARIPRTETFSADTPFVGSLVIVGVLSQSYHLANGYIEEKGQTLICKTEDGRYTVGFYKPDSDHCTLVGIPVVFGTTHPTGIVYKDRPAMVGDVDGKRRMVYMNEGQLILEDN
jgi:hypothetical protein